jgi:hypothetical protein
MLPNINENVTINELTRLNDTLRKSSEVGYQSNTMGAGSLSPIVPQSIEGTLASAAHTMRDLALWPMLPKVQATNTLHEYAVIRDHGEDLDPFISEGGGSEFGASASQYERKSVKIKYMAEKRSISDVASLVGIVGPNADALAEETERGTMSLLRKMEVQLFHGDEDVNVNAFDGVLKQIERGDSGRRNPFRFGRDFSDNQEDLGGSALTGEKLHEVLGELYSAPRFGQPDAIFMSPKAYSKLISDSAQNGRHDSMIMVNQGDQGVHTIGAGPRIHVMGPMGPVPVVAAPFISRRLAPPSVKSASSDLTLQNGAARFTSQGVDTDVNYRAAVTALNADLDTSVGWDPTGNGDHQGDYRYVFVMVNKKGYSDPILSDAVDAHDGQIPKFNLAAQTAGDAPLYVRIYRCKGDLSDAQCLRKAQLIGEVKADEIIGADWFDAGFEQNDCDSVLITQLDQGVIEFARLLDFIRRPLAEVGAAKQFLLMLFGAPSVKVPKKNFVLRNAASK